MINVIKYVIDIIENMTSIFYNNDDIDILIKEALSMEVNKQTIRLRELRKESKLTQEQLAQYLEVDQSLITKMENGTRSLNITIIDKLCCLFGCTPAYLMGEDEKYIPLNFAFRSSNIQAEDLKGIAAVNKIVMNIRYMNEQLGE